MNRNAKVFVILILSVLLLPISNVSKAQGNIDNYDQYDNNYGASYQDFYDGLAPYGRWMNDPQFGYVWMPNVGSDFRPYYTNGYWAMTEYGNTWVSNYDWGWAAFHYGRWTYDNYYGWLWIPDTQWAPAWVSWRSNYNYYGWAPMGPGVNINISLGSIPIDWWVFLSPNYFYEPRFQRYCNNDWRFTRSIYSQTNYYSYTNSYRRVNYYSGPRADDYRRRTGRQSSFYSINDNNRRGPNTVRGNQINIYRPTMRNSGNNAPTRIVNTNRNISTQAQSFANTNVAPAGRQRVLNQQPVQNTIRNSNTINGSQQNNNRTNNIAPNSTNNQRANTSPNIQNQRSNNDAQAANERARVAAENQRQQELQQRDRQMIREENNRTKSVQSEESTRQMLQQNRDAQIQRQQQAEQQNRATQIQRQQQSERQNSQQNIAPQRSAPQERAPVRQAQPTQERSNNASPARSTERGNTQPANNSGGMRGRRD